MNQVLRPNVVFESGAMPASTAIEAWHEIASSTLSIEIDKDDQSRFSLLLRAIRLDETVVTASETTAQALYRDQGRAQRDGLDQYGFFLQVTGSRVVRANGNDTVLMPGDMQFVDMAQEDFTVATDGQTTTLYVPRQVVEDEVPWAWRLHGTVIRNTATQVLANQMLTLFDPGCGWPTTMAGFLERSLLSLAFGCLVEAGLDATPSVHTSLDLPMRRRIETYIEEHLTDQTLDAHRIGQEFGLSRSVIYRTFQTHGGLHRYILGRRLRRVRKYLLEGDERTIAEIALANGFVSPAHFNREFRRTFSATPTEVRSRQRFTGHDPFDVTSLDQLLRSTGSIEHFPTSRNFAPTARAER